MRGSFRGLFKGKTAGESGSRHHTIIAVTSSAERQRLLYLVVDLILSEGMIDVSLSAVARKIGSNNRMLLYYFGSKEALLDEAAMHAYERFPKLRNLFQRLGEPGDIEERLVRAWEDLSAPENHPYLRVFFQRFGIAMRETEDWGGFIERLGTSWVQRVQAQLAAEGLSDSTSRSGALAIVALWRGMEILLLARVPAEELSVTYRLNIHGLLTQLHAEEVAHAR